jgi:hypothetical protein
MKRIKSITLVLGILAASILPANLLLAGNVSAASCTTPQQCASQGANTTTDKSAQKVDLKDRLKDIVNILLFVLGAIAVIIIVIGGLRYVLSGGDANAVKGAKDTILYAVVGLIIALLAYAIVNFVITQFT